MTSSGSRPPSVPGPARWSAAALVAALLLVSAPAGGQQLLSLKEAYRAALESHPSIAILQARVRQAEAARYRAWSALKPTAAFQGTFTHYDKEIAFDFPGAGKVTLQKQNQFGWNVVAKLPLFVGPAYPGIGIAGKQVKVAKLRRIRSERDFLLQVARAYYSVVTQKEVVKALENKVAVDSKHLTAARAKFEVGQSPRANMLRADLVHTQSQQQLLTARNGLRAARRQLAILIGRPGSVEVKRPATPPDLAGGAAGGLDAVLKARHDYRATEVSRSLAQQSKNAVWWGFLPSLDATWLYRWTESEDFVGDRGSWNLMFTVNVPIYDGGTRYANLRESDARIREASQQQRALAQQIEADIVRLRTEVQSANSGVISARKAAELARTTASDIEASFEAGAATQLDVLDANQRKLDAEIALTRSLFQRDLARLALAHALGRFDPV